MARRKVALKYIPHEKTRRETLKKRIKSLMKKAGEVAVLCNIKACVIVYPEGKSMPQVFSSHDDDAVAIMNRLRTMKDDDPFNKKMDHECFLEKCSGKLQEQTLKAERGREENETRLLLHKSMLVGNVGLSVEELTNVDCKVDVFLKSIRDRITKIQGQPPVYQPSQVQASNANFTIGIGTIGAPSTYQPQPLTPYVTKNMGAIRAPTMYKAPVSSPSVTAKMDTIGAPTLYHAQAPTPYVNGTMDANGAPMVYQAKVPPQQHEEWLELMRSGGGDLGAPIDLGTLFSCPWGGADTGPSSSAFPPM
ncbi:hypothetical protein ACQ4PT_019298 [Festuca glaucescens]